MMKKLLLTSALIVGAVGTYKTVKSPAVAVSSPSTNITVRIIPFYYPTNINPNDYNWYLQMTTDFTNWTTIQTNDGTDNLWVDSRTNPFAFYRLSSQP